MTNDRKDQETKMRRISGDLCVVESKANATIEGLRKSGFGAKIIYHCAMDDDDTEQYVIIDVWRDVTSEDIELLALHGFRKKIDFVARDADADAVCMPMGTANLDSVCYVDPAVSRFPIPTVPWAPLLNTEPSSRED